MYNEPRYPVALIDSSNRQSLQANLTPQPPLSGSSSCLATPSQIDGETSDSAFLPIAVENLHTLKDAKPPDAIYTSEYASNVFDIRLGYSLPPKFIPDPQVSGVTIRFIMYQYEPLLEIMLFRPVKTHIDHVQKRFANRLMASDVTHWSMFIGAQMFRTLRKDGGDADVQRFIPWLDRLDQLCVAFQNDASLEDMIGRLNGALEVAFLKYVISSAKSRYILLQRTAPLFMRIAFADPELWPRDPSSNGVSLAHALVAPQFEIGRFIFTDAGASLTFGVPPLVEYDTSHPVILVPGGSPFEWAHGCPLQFVFSSLRIGQWRARYPNGCSEEQTPWKEIERDTWSWSPACDYGSDSESSRFVTIYAVQESWRHALLIYLYMGMCGVNSHDSRVQASVRQISQLNLAMNHHFDAGMHKLIPVLLAGICTRRESDRKQFRAIISQPVGRNKTWLLTGIDFAPVLDHLWRGVGANGAPVTWEDYIASRRAVIDIGVRL